MSTCSFKGLVYFLGENLWLSINFELAQPDDFSVVAFVCKRQLMIVQR